MAKITTDQAEQVRMARLDGWRRMAKETKHHILSVELLRTKQDQTAAVFTVNLNGEVVQYIVRGDARGRLLVDDKDPRDTERHGHHEHHGHHHDHHHHEHGHECGDEHGHEHGHHEPGREQVGYAAQAVESGPTTQLGQVRQAFMAMALAPTNDPADPNIIALGEPPPKQDPPPGIAAVGGVLLASAFDVAEQVPASGAPPK